MVRRGHAVSPNAAQAQTTAWSAAIALTAVAQDVRSAAPPAAGFLSHIEVDIDTIAGGCTALNAMLHHDSGRLKALAGPSGSTTLWLDGAGKGSVTFFVGADFDTPTTITPGTWYISFQTNAGTCNVTALGCRAVWTDARGG